VTVADPLFASYLRHGRVYGVGDEFWAAAADDLDARELRGLARELEVNFPEKWSTRRNGHREPAPEAGSSADISRKRPMGRGTPNAGLSVDTNGCQECGGQVAYLTRTGLCRRCQSRLAQRRRRARNGSSAA
jgi:ribosomal protein S14